MGDFLGYARVSTRDQNLEMQLDALNEAGCVRIFSDKVSGTQADRPELNKMLEYARPGDTIVVWKLDRFGRNLRDLLDQINALDERGVGFKSLGDNLDTTSPGGRLIFHVFEPWPSTNGTCSANELGRVSKLLERVAESVADVELSPMNRLLSPGTCTTRETPSRR